MFVFFLSPSTLYFFPFFMQKTLNMYAQHTNWNMWLMAIRCGASLFFFNQRKNACSTKSVGVIKSFKDFPFRVVGAAILLRYRQFWETAAAKSRAGTWRWSVKSREQIRSFLKPAAHAALSEYWTRDPQSISPTFCHPRYCATHVLLTWHCWRRLLFSFHPVTRLWHTFFPFNFCDFLVRFLNV